MSTEIRAIEIFADDSGWHTRVENARVPLTDHDNRDEAEIAAREIAGQQGGRIILPEPGTE